MEHYLVKTQIRTPHIKHKYNLEDLELNFTTDTESFPRIRLTMELIYLSEPFHPFMVRF